MVDQIPQVLPAPAAPLPSQLRRDIVIRNIRLSHDELFELFDIVTKRNLGSATFAGGSRKSKFV
jgi:hypothetical protein